VRSRDAGHLSRSHLNRHQEGAGYSSHLDLGALGSSLS
jgi:hypothetical protein